MFIYKIENKVNGKLYIGLTTYDDVTIRWGEHMYALNNNIHKNSHLQNAWNKYGSSNFVFSIISEYPSDFDIVELGKIEIRTIALYDSNNPNKGYNLSVGGELPNLVSFEKHNQKIIKCGKYNNKQRYALKRNGKVVLSSINRAKIFSAYFGLEYPIKKVGKLAKPKSL